MAATNFLKHAIINHFFRGTSQTSPGTVYVALFEDAAGTEPSGGGYARQEATFGAPSGGVSKNTSKVTFPAATADLGNMSHFGVFDAASGGNQLTIDELTSNFNYNTGVEPEYEIDALQVNISP